MAVKFGRDGAGNWNYRVEKLVSPIKQKRKDGGKKTNVLVLGHFTSLKGNE